MKKPHLYFMLIGALMLLGCRNQTLKPDPVMTGLSGTVKLAIDSLMVISIDHKLLEIPIIDGQFSTELPIYEPCYCQLEIDGRKVLLYMTPGSHLSLDAVMSSANEEIKFTGRGAESNAYLHAHSAFEIINKPDYQSLFDLDDVSVKQELRRFRTKEFAFLNKYQRKNINLDPKFMTKERSRILYRWGVHLFKYYSRDSEVSMNELLTSKEKIFDYKNELSLNESRLIGLPEYDAFVRAAIHDAALIHSKGIISEGFAAAAFDAIDEYIDDPDVKDLALELLMETLLTEAVLADSPNYLNRFLEGCQNGDRIVFIQELFDTWLDIQKGKVTFSIPLINSQNETASLRDHSDQLVYIYFWSVQDTIQKELSDLQDLQMQIPNVKFVSVCIDAWKAPARFNNLTHDEKMHLASGQEVNELLWNQYLLRHFPASIIVDAKGRIIYRYAPPPTSGKIQELLTQVLAHS